MLLISLFHSPTTANIVFIPVEILLLGLDFAIIKV